MRKILAVILSFCMLLCFAGCFNTDNDPTDGTTTVPTTNAPTDTPTLPSTNPSTEPSTEPSDPSTEPTDEIIFIPELPLAGITLTNEVETEVDADGNTIFTYTYQNVRLHLPSADIADLVTLDLLNRIDSTRSEAESILEDAQFGGEYLPYYYSVHYEPMRIDPMVLSLYGEQTSFSGISHPYSTSVSLNYDLTTGELLTLSDILTENCTAEDLCLLVVNALAEYVDEYYLYDDYSATVEDRFSGNFLADEGWYFAHEGLCFYFSPYEVAPYSSGAINAIIPYDQLQGLLKDEYFHMELASSSSTMTPSDFDDADLSLYEEFPEVVLSSEGETYLLTTDGFIYDVRIELGSWTNDNTVFVPNQTVFAASSLTNVQAIVLQLDASDTSAAVRISYMNGTETNYIIISVDE